MARMAVVFIALVLAGSATNAQASSTASVQGTTIVVTGDGGANDIGFDGGNPHAVPPYSSLVRDATGITAGAGCTQDTDTSVACGDGASVNAIEITGGGGADRIAVSSGTYASLVIAAVTVNAGDGDDILQLGAMSTGPDNNLVPVLDGGAGDDQINAGGDAVTIDGGPGLDVLGGTGGNDTIRGGDDKDEISGNPGNDRLFGDGGDDNIQGGGGDDEVTGGAGSDTLSGDAGSTAHPGNDMIEARDGERDTVSCDFGADVANVDSLDVVESGMCETVNRSDAEPAPGGDEGPSVSARVPASITVSRLLSRGVRVVLATDEPVGAALALFVDAATARRLGVGAKETALGKASATLASQKTLTLRIAARFRKKIARAKRFTLRVLILAQDGDGNKVRGVKSIRARR